MQPNLPISPEGPGFDLQPPEMEKTASKSTVKVQNAITLQVEGFNGESNCQVCIWKNGTTNRRMNLRNFEDKACESAQSES